MQHAQRQRDPRRMAQIAVVISEPSARSAAILPPILNSNRQHHSRYTDEDRAAALFPSARVLFGKADERSNDYGGPDDSF